MRHLVFCILFLAAPFAAAAQDDPHAQHSTPVPQIAGEPQFGSYGYRHGDLHVSGTIAQLMKLTDSSCCDGENSGECRVTTIRPSPTEAQVMEAFLEGRWCPIPGSVQIFTNLTLPEGAQAVVCAQSSSPGTCPYGVYCAGMQIGS